jgi:hypothetical protein
MTGSGRNLRMDDAGYDLTYEYVYYNNVNLYNLTFNKSDFDRMR